MPLPTPPSKLGSLLPPDEYKAKARPTKAAKKSAEGDVSTAADYGPASVAQPMTQAANAAAQLRAVASAPEAASAPARSRKTKQTAALLQPVPAPVEPAAPVARAEKPAAAKPVAAAASEAGAATRSRGRKAAEAEMQKLFVLDTNVLMHDPSSLFRFEEHDVYLPMMTLEELDNHKKGMSEVARNARQVSRTLDALVADAGPITNGIPLSRLGSREALGRLYFQTTLTNIPPVEGLPEGKADNQILGVVRALQRDRPDRQVVLVSKDINMRIKAHALGLPAEDYFNDQVLEDKDLLYTGVRELPQDFWTRHAKGMESWQDTKTGTTYYRVTGPLVASMLVNEFVYLEPQNGEPTFHALVRELNGKTALLQTLRDYSHHKNNVWGITARNREQNFALNLLMNPEIDFVTLLGQAGTGKTLVALAAGLAQVLDDKRYNEIIVTRATVPVGEDIGFLPGTEEEKMQPWMGAFDDNLEVLQKTDDAAGEWGRAATQELIRSRLKVKSMNFMRGRTFVDKYLIIDEAQNLTPKQMKTLVTRAGPGTKIVCLGNIAQIDTPYLTEGSSGLTYVVDRFKGWGHSGHVTLARGERSRLADYASDIL
ncbi:phosphate starvation-inducible protein PhoH [Burkholderia ubonensis]|uniref:Phosphate starvation-inducible protein PhoH n=1 Tax=Burkholderia ubonensis TaxID=101571 RepID=A0A102NEF8_9BURK|nr:PhoH family protein [Burkholderia ubonensis]AOI70587.1 phosphate starvation-inducible protein PhoH [Burkholderia ubonensis]KUZ18851.1 phosphate starvation-inducible protein PhoH [Burkholderia ubonensis]KUZ24250.1 phosphate starvation-inducible protein PhoH [Burkholderia ubonensis]KUZ29284.1 phosphate starvation-inducible protein PhoH [Burkholderia ubonensis]KUZ50712.1 phosphate starvation-inducible protein PhoH [Burkholderia ubonensis]